MIGENTNEITAHRLEQLAKLYRQGGASETVKKTLNKLFGYETEMCRIQLRELEEDLLSFENRYNISSEVFYQRFQEGKTDDDMDFIEWASIVQMYHRLQKRLFLLTEEQI